MATATQPSQSFQFCGRSFLAFVLKPEMPIGRWMTEADTWLTRSPGFLRREAHRAGRLRTAVDEVRDGRADCRSGRPRHTGHGDARRRSRLGRSRSPACAVARASCTSLRGERDAQAARGTRPTAAPAPIPSLLVDQPVRSGQSLFHEGDVTVIGSVSSGAEIVATGSIHIYGTLRGRVLAGADGNPRAHIFCRRARSRTHRDRRLLPHGRRDRAAARQSRSTLGWKTDALTIKALD